MSDDKKIVTSQGSNQAVTTNDAELISRFLATVKLQRQLAGLTQMELARRMKMSHTRLSLFENGLATFTVEEIGQLQKVLQAEMAKAGRKWDESVTYAYESAARSDGVPERKALRQRANMSQSEVSTNAQISQGRISQWESGKIQLTKPELARWESAIRIGIQNDIAKKALVEREILRDENIEIRQRVANVRVKVRDQFRAYKEEVERLQKGLIYMQEMYGRVIKDLKKENAKLRLAVKMKNRKAK